MNTQSGPFKIGHRRCHLQKERQGGWKGGSATNCNARSANWSTTIQTLITKEMWYSRWWLQATDDARENENKPNQACIHAAIRDLTTIIIIDNTSKDNTGRILWPHFWGGGEMWMQRKRAQEAKRWLHNSIVTWQLINGNVACPSS